MPLIYLPTCFIEIAAVILTCALTLMLWVLSWPVTSFWTQSSSFVYSGSPLVPGLAELCPGHKTLSFADSEESGGGGLVAKLCPTLATLWTVARQAPLSMGFSRQGSWNGLPCPSPGDLPDPGIEPRSPALQADSLPTELCTHTSACSEPREPSKWCEAGPRLEAEPGRSGHVATSSVSQASIIFPFFSAFSSSLCLFLCPATPRLSGHSASPYPHKHCFLTPSWSCNQWWGWGFSVV